MVASPKPPPAPDQDPITSLPAAEAAHILAEAIAKATREAVQHGGGSRPPDADKIIHNEITKLKATTLNSVAIAFFVGGGVAPLVTWATSGFTGLQAVLGSVWLILGFVLPFMARDVLKGLVP